MFSSFLLTITESGLKVVTRIPGCRDSVSRPYMSLKISRFSGLDDFWCQVNFFLSFFQGNRAQVEDVFQRSIVSTEEAL